MEPANTVFTRRAVGRIRGSHPIDLPIDDFTQLGNDIFDHARGRFDEALDRLMQVRGLIMKSESKSLKQAIFQIYTLATEIADGRHGDPWGGDSEDVDHLRGAGEILEHVAVESETHMTGKMRPTNRVTETTVDYQREERSR